MSVKIVSLIQVTENPTAHHFANNPFVGWKWTDSEENSSELFTRLKDCRSDAEVKHPGLESWKKSGSGFYAVWKREKQ